MSQPDANPPALACSLARRQKPAASTAHSQPDYSYNAVLGARIIALRHIVSITQRELANAAGVSRSAVAQWETGRSTPHLHHLSAVARTLQVTTDALLDNVPSTRLADRTCLASAIAKARADINTALDQLLHAAGAAP